MKGIDLINKLFDKLIALLGKISVILLIILVILLIVHYFLKFYGKSISKTIALEQTLKLMEPEKPDKIISAVNKVVCWASVKYLDNKGRVQIIVPTKRWFQLSSQLEVKKRIREMLSSEDFRLFLMDNLDNYRFVSRLDYYHDQFVLTGTRI